MRVFDLHCDTLDALGTADLHEPGDGSPRESVGDIVTNGLDLAADRMHAAAPEGWCQCYAVFVPDGMDPARLSALDFYRHVSAYLRAQTAEHADKVAQPHDARDIEGVLAAGKVCALLTIENGAPVESLEVLDQMAADGVKMITLTWNGKNQIASGNVTTDGMSDFGREVVRHMEELGIVVDVSHLNDAGFADLLKVATRPFAASHSNSRAVCGHKRNLTDDQFRAIVERGGIVGINYWTEMVSERCWGHEADVDPSFDELSAHIEHFLDLGGEKAVALGSDYDGSHVPTWLKGCQTLPAFYARVVARFGQALADDMFYGNAHRFFVANEER